MATEFTMPKLGLTMEEGTILEWLVPDGADVDEGSPVLVIQTDKVETEVNVIGSGRLQQVAGVGDTLACGEVVGMLLGAGEESPAGNRGTRPAAAEPPPEVEIPAATPQTAKPAEAATADGRQFVSPNARRVAAELGVDVTKVRGTGPGGRVVSEDVQAASAAAAAAGPPSCGACRGECVDDSARPHHAARLGDVRRAQPGRPARRRHRVRAGGGS